MSKKRYTQKELMKAVKFACDYQKYKDYQTAGSYLIVDKPKKGIEKLLNKLIRKSQRAKLTISEINAFLENG